MWNFGVDFGAPSPDVGFGVDLVDGATSSASEKNNEEEEEEEDEEEEDEEPISCKRCRPK